MALTKNWRGWVITDEQAEEIRNGDINARNRFYFDNLERIRKMAYNYAKRNPRCKGLEEDMINGVYVDMSFWAQENGKPVSDGLTLSGFVYSSFRFTPYGGLLYLSENNPKMLCGGVLSVYAPDTLSLDSPLGVGDNRHQDDNNAHTLGDIIPAPENPFNGDLTDNLKELVSDMLSPRENEFFGHFIEGYGNAEISRRMGYGTEANNADKVKRKLRLNSGLILSRLSALGVDVDYYDGKTPYNPKTERTYKGTPAQRARGAESMRRQRARKRNGNDLCPA